MAMDNEFYNERIKVYAKIDEQDNITAINSSIFLNDLNGWTEIDSGYGDKYAHAQGNYLDEPLTNENGEYNYKLINGKPVFIG